MTEEMKLVQAAQDGSEAAFEQLVHLYEKKVYNLCLRMCGNPEDAADAAQEAFLSAWRGLPFFRQEANFHTWLYRLTSNTCIDLLRRETRRGQPLSLDDEELHLDIADHAPQPQELLERQETEQALTAALAALPPDYRQVLTLRELQQLSYQEISEALDLDLNTVKTRIHRSRKALRKFLWESGNFFAPPASKETEGNKPLQEEVLAK